MKLHKSNETPAGVFQYFYHCAGEELPVRDVRNRRKTEPHYENLTENWCGRCMNNRIKSANRRGVKYLFLVTRYFRKDHHLDGKLLVVGFLYRAEDMVWRKLSRSRRSGVAGYDSNNPQDCGFFAGDNAKSRFVSAEGAHVLKTVKNGRWKYFADEGEAEKIASHLRKSKNILRELREKVSELKAQTNKDGSEKRCKTC
jgi:hypothetical protein